MKKSFLFFVVIAILNQKSNAQTCSLQPSEIVVTPLYNGNTSLFYVTKSIILIKLTDTIPKDSIVKIKLNLDNSTIVTSSIKKYLTLKSTEISIKGTDWNNSIKNSDSIIKEAIEIIQQAISDTLKQLEIATIYIEGKPENKIIVRLVNANSNAKPDNDYWVETGTNFDFIDGVKAGNLTGGIFFHKINFKSLNTSFALNAGIYETKSVSNVTTDSFPNKQYVTDKSIIPGRNDSLYWFRYFAKQQRIKTSRTWSFFASPQWELCFTKSEDSKINDSKFHVFFAPWIELQYQEFLIETNNSNLTKLDSGKFASTELQNYKSLNDTVSKTNIFAHYLGIGFPVFYEDEKVRFTLNPVIGLSNQPTIEDIDVKNYNGQPCWRPFYIAQFRLSEKFLGFTITGEIRGLLKSYSPPAYTLALTKKFNLEKVLKF